ncbi:hypothetical protein AAZX31_08G257300 [Glycine max]|uniref:Uncharacterized protein n=1 Tax=Glycine max TaxID=3847 RepID=K7K0R7_SOYBN|nr:hypothetical protein GYH30_022463 [Glycine max]KRH45293.1 hypothetical protein GLYMA_08G263300v4 [Glycine max]
MPQIVTSVSSSLKAQKSFLMRWTRRSSMRHPSPSSKRSTLSTTSSASAQRPQCLDCQIQASSCSSIQNYCQGAQMDEENERREKNIEVMNQIVG